MSQIVFLSDVYKNRRASGQMTGGSAGLLHLGFKIEITNVSDDTLRTVGLSGLAGIPAMQNQPVVSIHFVFIRHDFQKFELNLKRSFTGRQPGAVGNPKNMGINCDGGLSESGIQYNVGRFPTHSRQSFQRLTIRGYLAVMIIDKNLACPDDVYCFRVVEADGPDTGFQLFHPELNQ